MEQQSARRAPSAPRGESEPDVIYAPHGLADGISALAAEPIFAAILKNAGPPRFRRRRNGFGTLLHIILEQQVSIDAAAKMYHRLVELCRPLAPATFLALDEATLRSCGFSRQKMGYARDLAAAVGSGNVSNIHNLVLAACNAEGALNTRELRKFFPNATNIVHCVAGELGYQPMFLQAILNYSWTINPVYEWREQNEAKTSTCPTFPISLTTFRARRGSPARSVSRRFKTIL